MRSQDIFQFLAKWYSATESMKTEKIDASTERRILTGMIVSQKYLQNIIQIYRPHCLSSPPARTIAKWCLDYFQTYEHAPEKHIKDIYSSKLRRGELDEAEEKFIGQLLESLSGEWEHAEKFNVDYLMDQTLNFFKSKLFGLLSEDIKTFLIDNRVDQAEAALARFQTVELNGGNSVDPISDMGAIKKAFEESTKPLFTLPGALGKLMNEELVREGFVSFLAPEKRGKSYLLMYLYMRAYYQRCNVAVFETGDMSQNQRLRRTHSYISQQHVRGPVEKKIIYPLLDCLQNQNDSCTMNKRLNQIKLTEQSKRTVAEWVEDLSEYKACALCREERGFDGAVWYNIRVSERLDWYTAYKQARKSSRKVKGAKIRYSIHPNDSLNVAGIESQLDIWERQEDFVPDVIAIDYPDIMAPDDTRMFEQRQIENTRWKKIRALSQKRHSLVLTVTQADAASYKQKSLSESNFSEDKRKAAHVTALYAINQTKEEKRRKIIRIGELLVREDDFDILRNVHVLQCLDIGRPYIDSY